MKTRLSSYLPAALWILPLPALAGLLVTDLAGKAEIEGRGTVQLMAEIPDGATLTLASGSRLVAVDLGNGREYSLKVGRYLIEKSGPRSMGGGRVEGSALPAGQLPAVRIATNRVAQATLVMRSARKASPLVSPHNTAVTGPTPTLRWPETADAAGYRITLTDAGGKQLIDTAVPPAPTFALAASMGLQPGARYSWRVEARRDGRTLAEHGGEFAVLGPADAQRLAQFKPGDGATFSRRALYAALLMEAGVTEEARALWQTLRAERPEDPSLARLAE